MSRSLLAIALLLAGCGGAAPPPPPQQQPAAPVAEAPPRDCGEAKARAAKAWSEPGASAAEQVTRAFGAALPAMLDVARAFVDAAAAQAEDDKQQASIAEVGELRAVLDEARRAVEASLPRFESPAQAERLYVATLARARTIESRAARLMKGSSSPRSERTIQLTKAVEPLVKTREAAIAEALNAHLIWTLVDTVLRAADRPRAAASTARLLAREERYSKAVAALDPVVRLCPSPPRPEASAGAAPPAGSTPPQLRSVLWRTRGGDSSYTPMTTSGPTIAGRRLFTAGLGGVIAIDRASGADLWRRPFSEATRNVKIQLGPGGRRRWPGIVVDEANLYVADSNMNLLALQQADGATRWRAEITGGFLATPALTGGALIVPTRYGEVHAFDARDGKARWSRLLGGDLSAPAALVGDHVIVAADDGVVASFDAKDGSIAWLTRHVRAAVDAGPIAFDGRVFLGYESGVVVALDAETGEQLWTHEIDKRPAALVRVGDRVLVGGERGLLSLLQPSSGSPIWHKPNLLSSRGEAPVLRHPPVVAGEALLVSLAYPGVVAGLDLATGDPRWAYYNEHGGGYESSAVGGDGVVWVIDASGGIVALGSEAPPGAADDAQRRKQKKR